MISCSHQDHILLQSLTCENVKAEIKNVVLRVVIIRLLHSGAEIMNRKSICLQGKIILLITLPSTWKEFDKIFYQTIPQTAALYDPDRPYWPGSPHTPLDRERKSPDFQTASGDVHTYEVWGGTKGFNAYSEMGKYRFVSEFGFQSLPHVETVRSFTEPSDRYFPSAILDHHNLTGRKPDQNQGNVRIITYAADMFRLPSGMKTGSQCHKSSRVKG